MIEPYNITQDTSYNLMLGNMMEGSFFLVVILLTVWIITSLIIWFVGNHIKSEKAIKFGIKNYVLSILMQVFILIIPIIVANFIN